MQVRYCFEAKKRVGPAFVPLVNGVLSVSEEDRGRTTFRFAPLCHGNTRQALTRPVALREQEFELEARSPEGAEHPYTVTVHGAEGCGTVEVRVTPAGEPEMMLSFHPTWAAERSVHFETHGLWTLLVTIAPDADARG